MSDLIERLRRLYVQTGMNYVQEAADEIERLRQWELVGREWIDKTDWMQSRDAPVRWLGKHRADALRDEIERLTAERDEHAHWRRDLADKLHYRETDLIELRRQLAEAEQDAPRYRWLRGDSCPDHSSRWTQWEVRCWKAPSWTGDLRRADLDDAIDDARGKE